MRKYLIVFLIFSQLLAIGSLIILVADGLISALSIIFISISIIVISTLLGMAFWDLSIVRGFLVPYFITHDLRNRNFKMDLLVAIKASVVGVAFAWMGAFISFELMTDFPSSNLNALSFGISFVLVYLLGYEVSRIRTNVRFRIPPVLDDIILGFVFFMMASTLLYVASLGNFLLSLYVNLLLSTSVCIGSLIKANFTQKMTWYLHLIIIILAISVMALISKFVLSQFSPIMDITTLW
jgi:hypothetical protein